MIVTGSAQGIGRGVALAAAEEGATVVLADRSNADDDRYCAKLTRPTKAPVLSSALRTSSIANGSVRKTKSAAATRMIPPRAAIASLHRPDVRAVNARSTTVFIP